MLVCCVEASLCVFSERPLIANEILLALDRQVEGLIHDPHPLRGGLGLDVGIASLEVLHEQHFGGGEVSAGAADGLSFGVHLSHVPPHVVLSVAGLGAVAAAVGKW